MDDERNKELLFPKYLEKGSTGQAVFALQVMGKAAYPEKFLLVICDGEFGEETSNAVKQMQSELGFNMDHMDGCFDPLTRDALRMQKGIDVELWLRSPEMTTLAARTTYTEW